VSEIRTTSGLPLRSPFDSGPIGEWTQEQDFVIRAGDDFAHRFTWIHNKQPFPLTGWTGLAQIKATAADSVELAEFTVEVVDAAAAIFQISIEGATTATLPVGEDVAVYDVQFTHLDGRRYTPVEGRISVRGDVTR
jgi:hypothetical protein